MIEFGFRTVDSAGGDESGILWLALAEAGRTVSREGIFEVKIRELGGACTGLCMELKE